MPRSIEPTIAATVFLMATLVAGGPLVAPAFAQNADLKDVLKCQTKIAKSGAKYANTVISKTLKCTNAVVECQINCENGVYGAPCDPDDRNSNTAFGECMDEADDTCAKQNEKIAAAEIKKRLKITVSCGSLSNDQLCGANTPGLNFEALAAGCAAIIPGWVCNLTGILDCVAGPLQQQIAEQMVALLDPRASEALSASGITAIGGIAQTVKVSGAVPPGQVDVWAIDGVADQEISVRVKTKDDLGGLSGLEPKLTYISMDGASTVANTQVVSVPCGVPNVCGQDCSAFKRRFPFSGTFFLAVESNISNGCDGGSYALAVTTAGGAPPVLVADDVAPFLP